jgi:hypothetical protein
VRAATRRQWLARLFVLSSVTAAATSPRSANASASDDAIADAQRSITAATQGAGTIEQAISGSKADERSPEARRAS